jgi:hypothetical protein
MTPKPRSPKLPSERAQSSGTWYRYYAGFSADFVRDILDQLRLGADQLLADPWNGSGTTTAVANELGLPAWGGDINPAMVVIAKARLLGRRVRPSELSLGEAVVDSVGRRLSLCSDTDPLRVWFRPEAATYIRELEHSAASLLDPDCSADHPTLTRVSGLSPLAAFFYLALFRTVRGLLPRFKCSNPTWVRQPVDERGKLCPTRETVAQLFRHHVKRMMDIDVSLGQAANGAGFRATQHLRPAQSPPDAINRLDLEHAPKLAVAHSTALPLLSRSVGAVISSPPYCTRIDYAVATSPELAVLGLTAPELRQLREAMIGSSTVRDDAPLADPRWGPTCSTFLKAVGQHPSKASPTYYRRNHLQYFDGLFRSLCELDRVLTPGAPCVLVVQDSHYKEVHNDLPTIVGEMGQALGWSVMERHDYPSTRHLGRVHRDTRATESALVLKTAS